MKTIPFYRLLFILLTSGIYLNIVISMEPDPLADSETDPNHVPAPTDYDFVDDNRPPREQNQLFRGPHISVMPEQIINNQNGNIIPAVSEKAAVLRCEENGDDAPQCEAVSPSLPTPTTTEPPCTEPEEIILRCEDDDQLETTEEIKTTEIPKTTEKQQISDTLAENQHEKVTLRCIDEDVPETLPPPTERNNDQQTEFYPRPCSVQSQQVFPAPATYVPPSTTDAYKPEIRAQRNDARVSVSQLFTINQECYPNCVSSSNFILSPPPSLPSHSKPCYSATEECKLKRLKRFIFNL